MIDKVAKPHQISQVAHPELRTFIQQFLYLQLHPDANLAPGDVPLDDCPAFDDIKLDLFSSARAIFRSPGDHSGINGLKSERVRCIKSWRKGPPRRDCIFVSTDPTEKGMRSMHVARLQLLFSFEYLEVTYPCALVQWFTRAQEEADPVTGLWTVVRELDQTRNDEHLTSVIHMDTIVRGAHLMPVFGPDVLPVELVYTDSLDVFQSYYVNRYIDQHAYEIAF